MGPIRDGPWCPVVNMNMPALVSASACARPGCTEEICCGSQKIKLETLSGSSSNLQHHQVRMFDRPDGLGAQVELVPETGMT